jgi:DNA-binding NtrC family response regulator
MSRRVVLVVEDGSEYRDAFRRLAPEGEQVEWLHAPDARTARELLSSRPVDAVFIDLVFDRTPVEALAGDRSRPLEHRVRNQGFYVLDAVAPAIPAASPVLIAYDFASQPARLEALRRVCPRLEGVPESSGAAAILARLLARSEGLNPAAGPRAGSGSDSGSDR